MAIRLKNGRWSVARLPSGDWHPEEVGAAVRIAGTTFSELSRRAGLPVHAGYIAAKRPHHDGEIAIASFLGLTPQDIWPSRFRSDGSRIPHLKQPSKLSPATAASLRQNDEAA